MYKLSKYQLYINISYIQKSVMLTEQRIYLKMIQVKLLPILLVEALANYSRTNGRMQNEAGKVADTATKLKSLR